MHAMLAEAQDTLPRYNAEERASQYLERMTETPSAVGAHESLLLLGAACWAIYVTAYVNNFSSHAYTTAKPETFYFLNWKRLECLIPL